MIYAIPAQHIDRMWPVIGNGIERCLAKGVGRWSVDEIRERAQSGAWLLFIIEESEVVKATIICSIETGTKRIFEVGMAWGDGLAECE